MSFSANASYALMHAQAGGGICRARLHPEAQVLDLRVPSRCSMLLWQQMRCSPLGQKHRLLGSSYEWERACLDGTVLRLAFHRESDAAEVFACQQVLSSSVTSREQRLQASLFLQNLTRQWIEAVVAPARELGYDAVICNEQEDILGPSPSTQLFVFNVSMLSAPEWLAIR